MIIEEAIYELLSENAGVLAALAGTSPEARIKPPGAWVDLELPYVVQFPVSLDDPVHTHDGGLEALKLWDYYQVSVFSADYKSGRTVMQPIIDALDGLHLVGSPAAAVRIMLQANSGGSSGGWYAGRDKETKVHHFVLNFFVAEAL